LPLAPTFSNPMVSILYVAVTRACVHNRWDRGCRVF
jgi:hypothetical protein